MPRIDQIIRACGAANKREALQLVLEGRVLADGRPVRAISERFDWRTEILVDGVRIVPKAPVTLMLYKPVGYLSATRSDKEPPVTALLPPAYQDLFLVGRLDLDAQGLLLLTSDGDLCHRIIMPEQAIEKHYYIEGTGQFAPDVRARFHAGMVIDNEVHCRPAEILVGEDGASAHVWVTEGKRHQVKRMAAAAGVRVRSLKRLAIGGLALDPELKPGQFRQLSEAEIREIFTNASAKIPAPCR